MILQFADTQSVRDFVQSHWRHSMAMAPLQDPVWDTLGSKHAHLAVHASWQCKPETTDAATARYSTARYWVFPMLAARQGMTVDSYYAGRFDPKQLTVFCSNGERMVSEGLRPDTAYVFVAHAFNLEIARAAAATHDCRSVDGFDLCVRRNRHF